MANFVQKSKIFFIKQYILHFLKQKIWGSLKAKKVFRRQEEGAGQETETGVDLICLSMLGKDRKVLTQKAERWSGAGWRDRC